jgi:hypothetical protein
MMGGALDAVGDTGRIISKISESGIDRPALAETDTAAVPEMLDEQSMPC